MANTTLYLRSDTAISIGTSVAPSGFLGGWANNGTFTQKALSLTGGASQQSISTIGAQTFTTGGTRWAAIQYLYGPLAAGSYGSGNWTWGGALAFTSASGSPDGVTALFLALINGSTGAVRTTILSLSQQPAGFSGYSSEATAFTSTASGSSFTATAGDLLGLEVGVFCKGLGSSSTTTPVLYDCGATAISSNDVAISSAQSFIQAPFAIATMSGRIFWPCPMDGMGAGGPFFSGPLGVH